MQVCRLGYFTRIKDKGESKDATIRSVIRYLILHPFTPSSPMDHLLISFCYSDALSCQIYLEIEFHSRLTNTLHAGAQEYHALWCLSPTTLHFLRKAASPKHCLWSGADRRHGYFRVLGLHDIRGLTDDWC
jgi:hypothetical protein